MEFMLCGHLQTSSRLYIMRIHCFVYVQYLGYSGTQDVDLD